MRFRTSHLGTLGLSCMVLMLAACAQVYQPAMLLDRLKNRGPVLLSADNPYLAANQFLSYQAERSPDIAGFLKHRGAPKAIEIDKSLLSSTQMNFFYPENGQWFSLESENGVWIINGPFTLSASKIDQIHRASQGFEVDATSGTSLPSDRAGYQRIEPRSRSSGESGKVYEEMAREFGSHPGEISPAGDLVHYVTFQDEDLAIIARWYTYSSMNEARIATINNMSPSQRLTVGDVIVVPRYLLRNPSRLTEPAYRSLKAIVNSER